MNCPGAAARRTSMAGVAASPTRSVCSIITTASAPRGTTPPVAIVVAEPGTTASAGAWPQTITSALRRSRRGAVSLAPAVSAARTAKPSTLARSNGGTSIGAVTSCASTRPSAAASVDRLRRQAAQDRDGAQSARAPLRPTRLRGTAPAAPRGGSRRTDRMRDRLAAFRSARSWPGSYHDLGTGRISFAVGRHHDPSVGLRDRGQRPIARGYGLGLAVAAAHRHDLGEPNGDATLRASTTVVAGALVRHVRTAAPACGGRA